MCGRFNLRTNPRDFADFFAAQAPPAAEQLLMGFNIAPTQDVLAVRADSGSREAVPLRWGLIPSWADDPKIGNRMINARSETAPDKPAFRTPFKRKRCLIPASGFYEWQKRDDGKQPYHIHPQQGGLMAFAGLWDRWQPADGDAIESCTILTTSANRTLSELHDRMPVILAPQDYGDWLEAAADVAALQRLLRSATEDFLDFEPVSKLVNNVRNTGPECLEAEKVQQRLL
jgi:putative SOS response-associated peptidase YedK